MSAEVKIQLRRDTANNWQGVNPVLADGEMGIETDTRKFKFGNGTTEWNSLPYAATSTIPAELIARIDDLEARVAHLEEIIESN